MTEGFKNPPQKITSHGFAEGDFVRTCKGAHFCGRCDVIFMTAKGKLRAVVEALDPNFEETLHVYPLEQLVLDVGGLP